MGPTNHRMKPPKREPLEAFPLADCLRCLLSRGTLINTELPKLLWRTAAQEVIARPGIGSGRSRESSPEIRFPQCGIGEQVQQKDEGTQ
jgi:hypothetical protein